MKRYIFILTYLLIHFGVQAQNNSVEAARVAFITQKIAITPTQAEKFWPLFNDLAAKKLEIRKVLKKTIENMNTTAEQSLENTKKNIELIASLKQKEINLDKEYQYKYLLILTPKQLIDLIQAEKEFQKILIKKVAEE